MMTSSFFRIVEKGQASGWRRHQRVFGQKLGLLLDKIIIPRRDLPKWYKAIKRRLGGVNFLDFTKIATPTFGNYEYSDLFKGADGQWYVFKKFKPLDLTSYDFDLTSYDFDLRFVLTSNPLRS